MQAMTKRFASRPWDFGDSFVFTNYTKFRRRTQGKILNQKRRNDMKPTKEQIEAYKEMAKTSPDSMKAMIEANLKATCDKYAGHEDRLDDCIKYLTDRARKPEQSHIKRR